LVTGHLTPFIILASTGIYVEAKIPLKLFLNDKQTLVLILSL